MAAHSRIARQLTEGNVQEMDGKNPMAVMGAHIDCEIDDDDVQEEAPVSVCMIGTGEYTTGYVHGAASESDKGAGGGHRYVVASVPEDPFFSSNIFQGQ